MGRISLYILLTLIYIGFSKSIISLKENRPLLKTEKIFDPFFQNAPLSVVLVGMFEQGYFLKSYFLKLRLVQAYFPTEDIVIQTSKEFYEKNLNNLGMSIYQRRSLDLPGRSIPQPSGSIFLGDLTYGFWKLDKSGDRVWEFHRAFRHFPEILGWGKFRPSMDFFNNLKIHDSYNQSYYGPNGEFGKNGSVSSKYFLPSTKHKGQRTEMFFPHLKKLFSLSIQKGNTNE
jgi:hypothetical protein